MEWEERWWEASDWAGMREMGAEKAGCRADGAAWRETWREAIAFDPANGEPMVERSAHKWAHDAKVAPALDIHCCPCTPQCPRMQLRLAPRLRMRSAAYHERCYASHPLQVICLQWLAPEVETLLSLMRRVTLLCSCM